MDTKQGGCADFFSTLFYELYPRQFEAFCKQFCKVNNLVMGSLPTLKLMMLSSRQLTALQTNCSKKMLALVIFRFCQLVS